MVIGKVADVVLSKGRRVQVIVHCRGSWSDIEMLNTQVRVETNTPKYLCMCVY